MERPEVAGRPAKTAGASDGTEAEASPQGRDWKVPGLAVGAGRASEASGAPAEEAEIVFSVSGVTVSYHGQPAIRDVDIGINAREITAFIGPSGCGKSTLLRCFNRMNDLIPAAHVEGTITYHGTDLYGRGVDPVEVRRRIGMVFQSPNPFPKSIYDNITFGPRAVGMDVDDLDALVEHSLSRAALWDEVKDKLDQNAYGLSGGQQQRLCIARAIAVNPDVILMDEPCSSLDPVATARIEDLMSELKQDYTILIVTHNMQQAARASDRTGFITTEVSTEEGEDRRSGRLVEFDRTEAIFQNPSDPRTEDYVTGRFG
jgi:phosphate transport system ATP-binding protein